MTDLNKIRAAQVRAAEQAAIAGLPPELLVGMEPKSPAPQPAHKHTPGPWREGLVVATGLPIKLQKYGDDIWWPREESDEEAQANLRLVDAAPELLKFVEDFLVDYGASEAFRHSAYITDAKALIAKATGAQT